jgi:hypothetical protein
MYPTCHRNFNKAAKRIKIGLVLISGYSFSGFGLKSDFQATYDKIQPGIFRESVVKPRRRISESK